MMRRVSSPARGSRRLGALARLTGLAAWQGVVGFYRSDNLTYAASIAYYGLLSLFPFSMLALAILGAATSDESSRAAVMRFVLRYFPGQFEFIRTQLDALASSSLGLGVAGSIFLVWGSLGVFGALTTAVNHAWGAEQPRTFWNHKLFSLLMMACASLLLLVGLLVVTATKIVGATWFAEVLLSFPVLQVLRGLAAHYATTALFVGVVGLIFYFAPNAEVRFRDVWIGAVVTGILWSLTLEGFSWLFLGVGRMSRIHGSVAAVVVFLFWVYAQAVILLYGAEFTAAYSRLIRGRSETAPAAPTPRS
jgi:membrane protein